jgi:preprotein translocase subunit SecA
MFHIEVDRAPQATEQPVAQVDYTYQEDPVQGFDAAAQAEGDPEPVEERGPPVAVVEQRVLTEDQKIGRNDPCPCGSGKKYKHCHLGKPLPAKS